MTDEEETLGERIRRLRTARGMSLAKIAGEDFSRAFLSQVELGHVRPSIRVLRVIANRLQKPVDYLLEGTMPRLDREVALEKARTALALGRHQDALAFLESALDAPEWPLGVDARLCAGQAMLGLGRLEDGRALLEEQRLAIAAHGDRYRLERLDALLAGADLRLSGAAHAVLADDLLAKGSPEAALEHYRMARTLLEGQTPAGKV
ncbi:MAG: hypothetical protein NVS9B1_18530 [Candidatus Dormibacteraceae bacterium]